jgi:hypothetical protein
MTAFPTELRSVEAALNYLAASGTRPVTYTFEPPPGIPWRSGALIGKPMRISDARPLREGLSLDVQGFALVTHQSAVADFYDPAAVASVYYRESERLVGAAIGAARVIAFDHNLRAATKAAQGAAGIKEPVKRVHNDFTALSGGRRARDVLMAAGEDADALLRHRFAIVNVWRPIGRPVRESPLAVCDARSIATEDLVAGDLVYRDRVGETYAVTFNPRHRWFYVPAMQPDEALLIKCFESQEAGTARFTAHAAFDDPTSPHDAPPRESIEVRTLALFAPSATLRQ